MLIKFTYVDAQTLRPMSEEPASAGPILPNVSGITIDFSNESEYPCLFPIFYGHCDDDADAIIPGILDVLTQESFDAALAHEQAARFERTKNEVRGRRSWLLAECDWTQLADAPLSAEIKAAYAIYRQALRDVTAQVGFPDTIDWSVDPLQPDLLVEST
jgi:hypothetical protein